MLLVSFMSREDFKQPFIGLEHAKLKKLKTKEIKNNTSGRIKNKE